MSGMEAADLTMPGSSFSVTHRNNLGYIITAMPQAARDQLHIRNYSPEELPILFEIDQMCFSENMAFSQAELRFYLKHPLSIVKVAELAGVVVGFAVGRSEAGEYAHVITVDVIPDAQRQKVGTALMHALHEEFRLRNNTWVVLEVDAGNEAAQRFYQELGYQRKELLLGYYKDRSNAYRMSRAL